MAKIDDILDKNSAAIKKGLKKEFDLLMVDVLKSGVSYNNAKKIVKERLKAVYGLNISNMAKGMKEAVGGSWSSDEVANMDVEGVKLSSRLYANIKDVQDNTLRAIKDGIKERKTIREISKLLYEGYDFKVDPLQVKKRLPKYLMEDIKTMSTARINKIKTPALKAAYLDTLNAKSEDQLQKSLKRAFYERNRYYADRIAQTEIFKAHSKKVAQEMMDDDTLEVVKIRLSRTHPKRDICDYHTGVDKYGLGKGVYPKAKAPLPPYHPFCRCKLMPDITKSTKEAKHNPEADNEFMDRLSRFEKSQILGSQRRVDMFLNSGSVLKSGYYDSPEMVGDVWYNFGMEKYQQAIEEIKYMLREIEDKKILTKNKIAIGKLDKEIIKFLEKKDVVVYTELIYLTHKGLSHLSRDSKKRRGAGLSKEDILKIPEILRNPSAVYFDAAKNKLNLLYCKDKKSCNKIIKIVVDTNAYDKKFKNISLIKTAGYVEISNLKSYEVIYKDVESQ